MDRIRVPKSWDEGSSYFEFDGAVSFMVEDSEGGFNLIVEYNFDSLWHVRHTYDMYVINR